MSICILDTLSKEYTQKHLRTQLEYFTLCVQCIWGNLHEDDDDYEMEYHT